MMTMDLRSSRCLAVTLVVALAVTTAGPVCAGSPAVLTGRVVTASGASPIAGARVHVADPRTNALKSSAATATDGTFDVRGLAPASYRLAVESDGGLYVVDAPVVVAAGEHRSVQLSVSSNAAERPSGEAPSGAAKKAATSVWNNPLTATLIVVGGAVVLGAIIGRTTDDNTASPSSP